MNITINIIIQIVWPVFVLVGGGSVIVYFVKHPETVDKWASLFYKLVSRVYKGVDDRIVKHDTQRVVNSYLAALREEVPNMAATSLKINWIDENISQDQFIKSGNFVLRMHKSYDQNKNIVNVTFTFVSSIILKKAKQYLAQYQKNAINLFVSYDILSNM